MAKKPKPVARRTARQKAEDVTSNPFVSVVNKAMNIVGQPALILAVASWVYHGIEDTKNQVSLLQNTVVEQHAGTAGDIQQLRDGMKAIWQQIGKMLGGK